jgi:hypothetical protein
MNFLLQNLSQQHMFYHKALTSVVVHPVVFEDMCMGVDPGEEKHELMPLDILGEIGLKS